jgi:hypothetical protein
VKSSNGNGNVSADAVQRIMMYRSLRSQTGQLQQESHLRERVKLLERMLAKTTAQLERPHEEGLRRYANAQGEDGYSMALAGFDFCDRATMREQFRDYLKRAGVDEAESVASSVNHSWDVARYSVPQLSGRAGACVEYGKAFLNSVRWVGTVDTNNGESLKRYERAERVARFSLPKFPYTILLEQEEFDSEDS